MRTGPLWLLSAAAARRESLVALLFTSALAAHPPLALAGGGPFGIDHRVAYDDSGIWARSDQNALIDSMMAVVGVGALWEGGDDRFGKPSGSLSTPECSAG